MPWVRIEWPVLTALAGLESFAVYGSGEEGDRGERLAVVPVDQSQAEVQVEEGTWWFTVFGRAKGGAEREIARSRRFVTGREEAPPTLRNVAMHHVEPSLGFRLAMDVPYRNAEPFRVQVVEGPSVTRGKLIAELDVQPAGPLAPDGSRLFTAHLALEGSGAPSGLRTIHARGIGLDGRGGPSVSRTVVVPDRHAFEPGIVIASVAPGVPTFTGWPAPAADDPYTRDATWGILLKQFPTVDTGVWTGFGTISSGLWASNRRIAPYVDNAKIETDEADLGEEGAWVLDVYDEVQRKTEAGYWPSTRWKYLSYLPTFPADDFDLRGRVNAGGPLTHWLMREILWDGTPRQPLRDCKWQYVIGTAAGVSHADGDYIDYTPGAWVYGRYVRMRLVLVEPTGWHQIAVPRVSVSARKVIPGGVATKIRETGGPTTLDVAAIADGEFLRRVGTQVVGASSSGNQTIVAYSFFKLNPAASLTASALLSSIDGSQDRAPPAIQTGKIVGIAWSFGGSHGNGVVTIRAVVSGTPATALEVASTTTAVRGHDKIAAGSADTLAEGAYLGCEIDTDGDWDGTAGMLTVTIYVLTDNP